MKPTTKTRRRTAASKSSPAPEARPQPAIGSGAGRLRVALAQIAPALGDRQRNAEKHRQQIDEAAAAGADLVVFPELSLTGYYLRDMVPEVALERTSREIEELVERAGSLALVAGFVEESAGHHFYNAGFFSQAGRLLHVHRKVYLPTYGLFEEQRYFSAGKRFSAFDAPGFGRVGLVICEDLWHVSAATIMQAEEVDLLVWVINSPARGMDGSDIRTAETYKLLARSYAQLLGALVVLVNRVGFEDGLCFFGNSLVVGPDGQILGEAPQFDECLLTVSCDLAELRRQRLITPLGRDEQLLLTIEELERIKRRRYEE
ncbi:MAG TPA: nitrilase-related carbon-nitrogen hydrolase [Pirellulales bacterium]|nr:nitrilase-related carbon-nitrogen hydrolase [Pirellulales bacterium]